MQSGRTQWSVLRRKETRAVLRVILLAELTSNSLSELTELDRFVIIDID